MRKVVILLCLVQLLFTGFAQAKPGKDREYWVKTMIKIIDPLYTNLSQNTLRKNMPVETFDGLNNGNTRKNVTHLEALGRSFNGISAWLNLPPDINGKTNCSTFTKHFVPNLILLTQNKMCILLRWFHLFTSFVYLCISLA